MAEAGAATSKSKPKSARTSKAAPTPGEERAKLQRFYAKVTKEVERLERQSVGDKKVFAKHGIPFEWGLMVGSHNNRFIFSSI